MPMHFLARRIELFGTCGRLVRGVGWYEPAVRFPGVGRHLIRSEGAMPQGGCRPQKRLGLRGVSRTSLAAVARSAGVVLALAALAATAHAQTSWLDSPPPPWNVPGAPVPAAPPGGGPVDPQCQAQERAPVGSEEMAVVARGWRLTSAWPIQRAGVVAVLRATAAYDGMCRPTEYNAFVFEGGQFAGTLSPVNMFARTDGALVDIPVV